MQNYRTSPEGTGILHQSWVDGVQKLEIYILPAPILIKRKQSRDTKAASRRKEHILGKD